MPGLKRKQHIWRLLPLGTNSDRLWPSGHLKTGQIASSVTSDSEPKCPAESANCFLDGRMGREWVFGSLKEKAGQKAQNTSPDRNVIFARYKKKKNC